MTHTHTRTHYLSLYDGEVSLAAGAAAFVTAVIDMINSGYVPLSLVPIPPLSGSVVLSPELERSSMVVSDVEEVMSFPVSWDIAAIGLRN